MRTSKDLHVSGPAYNTSLAIYFVGYVIFEVPSNVSLIHSIVYTLQTYQPSNPVDRVSAGLANTSDGEIPYVDFVFLRLKRFDPRFWLPTLTLAWGIASVCQGFVTNQAGLFGIRFRQSFLSFLHQ